MQLGGEQVGGERSEGPGVGDATAQLLPLCCILERTDIFSHPLAEEGLGTVPPRAPPWAVQLIQGLGTQ